MLTWLTIDVDDATKAHLDKYRQPGESDNDVLRRFLGMPAIPGTSGPGTTALPQTSTPHEHLPTETP